MTANVKVDSMGSLGLSDACRLRRAPKSDARLPGLEERWSISFEMSDGVVSVGAARATNGLLKKLVGAGRRIKTGRKRDYVDLCPLGQAAALTWGEPFESLSDEAIGEV